jgi:two-component system, OmpR family, sensor histidine kinase CreC
LSKRTRILVGILLVYTVGIAFMLYRVVSDLDPRYRESAEESLVETSYLLASLIEQDVRDGALDTARLDPLFKSLYARRFEARIFSVTKTRVEVRAYVTDRQGRVLFDSTGQNVGADYSKWRDVRLALKGEYGARSTQDVAGDADSAVMYVGVPLRSGQGGSGEIIGAVTLGKPVQSFGQFVSDARKKTLYVGIVSVLSVLVLVLAVSVWLVRPFGLISDYARFVRAQDRFSPSRLVRRALDVFGSAYDEMRDALAGRNYVADYVQTLTHEVKSPLSAIRGAAELLQEPMPDVQRQRFLSNIQQETLRIQEMVDRMMELTSLESRRVLERVAPVALRPLLEELAHATQGTATQRNIQIKLNAPHNMTAQGDSFLLRRALSNLLDNALEFSPEGSTVQLTLSKRGRYADIAVRDQGAGIPGYARDKVFEKFYSLARPHTRKKSTGLGLSFVKEIAALHHGRIELVNRPDDEGAGAVATLSLPAKMG